MMKRNLIALTASILLFACSQKTETDINTEVIDSDTLAKKVETQTLSEEKLFDMHPEPFFEEEQADELKANIKYYAGEIEGDKIELILNQLNKPHRFIGHYLYSSNGACFEIEADWLETKDSIFIKRYKDSKVREEFKGACTEGLSEINGIWIKGESEKPFSLKEVKNSPEQTQVYINLDNKGEFILTQNGIRLLEGYSGMERFNNFMFTNQMGSAYDFGEEWNFYESQVFFDQDVIVYSSIDLNNTSETLLDGIPDDHEDINNYKIIGMDTQSMVIGNSNHY